MRAAGPWPDPARWRLRLHLPSLAGRARADAGPLLLAVLVVALGAALAGAVPPAGRRAADRAVTAAVATAGEDAALVASVPLLSEYGPDGTIDRDPAVAQESDDVLARTGGTLPPELAQVLGQPVVRIVSEPLGVVGHGTGRSLALEYASAGSGEPAVRWTAGRAPGPSVPAGRERTSRRGTKPWTVEVGLVEQAAAELGVRAGDLLDTEDAHHLPVHVRVTGVYRAADERAPVWAAVPALLRPTRSADPDGRTYLSVAGLVSRASLPDAVLSVDESLVSRQLVYRPEPGLVRWGNSAAVVSGTVRLQAGTYRPDAAVDDPYWFTGLDGVLRRARTQVVAAFAQGAVLLGGLVTAVGLVLLLAADLTARRRAATLAGARERGASVPWLALELGLESAAVAAAGALAGGWLARVLDGTAASPWLVPVLVVAVVAPPAAGVRLAWAATSGRRAPADRSARASISRTGRLRRAVAELAVVLLAVAAFVALRGRGILPPAGAGAGDDLLPALAPALGAVAGALVLRRAVPAAARRVLAGAARSRRALPLVAAARVATAGAALPFVVVGASAALLGLGSAVVATTGRGQVLAAWQEVGADARLTTEPSDDVAALARRVAGAGRVRAAVAARVADGAAVSGDAGGGAVRLVVVGARDWDRLRAATPLPAAADLGRLPDAAGGASGPLPALLRSTRAPVLASRALRLAWSGRELPVRVVGTAPAVGTGDGAGDVVVVDTRSAAAAGLDTRPNTVWAVGPGAADAVAAAAREASSAAVVTLREDVLRQRRGAPLPSALRGLAAVSVVVLVAVGVLGLVLGAAAGAPGRGETLARLRTLGLRRREAWRVMLAELLPGALVAALGGLAVGVLLARACLGPLSLRLVTGQPADPVLVVPWWTVVPALLVVSSVGAVVACESSLRRRERLGLVLRAGGG